LKYPFAQQNNYGGAMLFIFDRNQDITQLHADLRNFGLNPNEWNLLRERSQTYKVQSKLDQSFIFLGKAAKKGKKFQWKKLELVSL
jgi:hypothetical protein